MSPEAASRPPDDTAEALRQRIEELEARLGESEETLQAIRSGAVDAVVVSAAAEHRVYTLDNADRPYRVLIEQIGEGAVTLGADGTVFYCNQQLARMLGTAQERVAGQQLHAFLQPGDASALHHLLDAARHGAARGDLTLRAPDGAATPVHLSLSLLRRDEQAPLFCGLLADLTQQQLYLRELSDANARLRAESAQRAAAEEALRQSQKMEAVGQLTGGLAHDFNNLLTGIVGSLELMRVRIAQGRTAELNRYIAAALASAGRAAALTHRLLAFSRRQTLDPRPVDPNALVTGMEELLRRTAGPAIVVRTALAADAGVILCDPNQLENALLNLCINARDAMPGGGTLTIATTNVEIPPDEAAAQDMSPGPYVAVCVADTGTGMAPDVMARAFDPFFTTKPIGQGTGLGLSMIYGFARQSGGHARLESEAGRGTAVHLCLPRHAGPADAPPPPPGPSDAPRAGHAETVLVVDDETVVRKLVVEVLEDLGYHAIEAADGPAGLRELQSPRRIDLLVTDVGLPGGLNGRQVADAARTLRPGLKVLFITGYAETAVLDQEHLEPGMHVMTKPFAIEALATHIQTLLTPSLNPNPRP